MHALPDHKIEPIGFNKMIIKPTERVHPEFGPHQFQGRIIATASRDYIGAVWTIRANVDKAPAPAEAVTRVEAAKALEYMALAVLPGTGYTTHKPHGMLNMP